MAPRRFSLPSMFFVESCTSDVVPESACPVKQEEPAWLVGWLQSYRASVWSLRVCRRTRAQALVNEESVLRSPVSRQAAQFQIRGSDRGKVGRSAKTVVLIDYSWRGVTNMSHFNAYQWFTILYLLLFLYGRASPAVVLIAGGSLLLALSSRVISLRIPRQILAVGIAFLISAIGSSVSAPLPKLSYDQVCYRTALFLLFISICKTFPNREQLAKVCLASTLPTVAKEFITFRIRIEEALGAGFRHMLPLRYYLFNMHSAAPNVRHILIVLIAVIAVFSFFDSNSLSYKRALAIYVGALGGFIAFSMSRGIYCCVVMGFVAFTSSKPIKGAAKASVSLQYWVLVVTGCLLYLCYLPIFKLVSPDHTDLISNTINSYRLSDSGHLASIISGFKLWRLHPFFGYGLAQFPLLTPLPTLSSPRTFPSLPASQFVSTAVEQGLIGISIMVFGCYNLCAIARRGYHRSFESSDRTLYAGCLLLIPASLVGAFMFADPALSALLACFCALIVSNVQVNHQSHRAY